MPKTKEELLSLPGVGTKIAMIYLRVAENKLDVHVSGIGDVNYKGNATVSQHVSGNGSVKKIQ